MTKHNTNIVDSFFFSMFSFFRQKLGMLLDTLKDEESGAHCGDDMLKTIVDIANKSASERIPET